MDRVMATHPGTAMARATAITEARACAHTVMAIAAGSFKSHRFEAIAAGEREGNRPLFLISGRATLLNFRQSAAAGRGTGLVSDQL